MLLSWQGKQLISPAFDSPVYSYAMFAQHKACKINTGMLQSGIDTPGDQSSVTVLKPTDAIFTLKTILQLALGYIDRLIPWWKQEC